MNNCKVIVNPKTAKKLLNMGNVIVDLKPRNDGTDRTVFVFEKTSKFIEDLKSISN